ncbi:MAG: T9SS type A sorting domain-containing protein, partial [Bacteroidota bacterium]
AGIRISDNYETDAQLRPNVVVETNLAKRNDTLWADLGGWKYVRYQITDGSGNRSKKVERFINIVLVGLEEVQEQNGVMLYPNPNNGQFNIRLKTELAVGGELVIYNVLGSKVHSQQLEKGAQLISVETVLKEQGVYYAQITAADGKQYEVRFIVK